jgi:hypothetical protein
MHSTFPCLIAPCLFLGSLVASGQERIRPPRMAAGPAFVAPRLLTDLTVGATNNGVDLVGDMDNDGDVDLLASVAQPKAVQFWQNDGSEHFTLAQTTSLGFWEFPQYLADVTSDGVLDLYCCFGNRPTPHSTLSVRPGLGDGRFGTQIEVSFPGYFCDIATGDCDGDGDLDVFFHDIDNSGPVYKDSLYWLRYEGGSFVPGTPLVLDDTYHSEFRALDIDGDGKADAVAASYGPNALLFYRTVSHVPTFDSAAPLPGELFIGNRTFRTGDLDGDGDDDVLVVAEDVDNELFWFQGVLNSPGGFTAAPLQSLTNDILADHYLRQDGELVDWDADGDLDFFSPTFVWMENTGGASFSLAGQVYWGLTSVNNFTAIVTDLDSDGHPDALARWVCMYGGGSFPSRVSSPSEQSLNALNAWSVLEDWEGDGDLDLVGSKKLHLNNGDGSFASRTTNPPMTGIDGQLLQKGWGDFDGDGFRDLVMAEDIYPSGFERMLFFTGSETGAYQLSPSVPSPVEMSSGLAGDLDGDGDVDILSTDGFWANDGAAHFGSSAIPVYSGQPLLALDLDRDGELDLFVDRGGSLEWLRNLGALSFQVAGLGIPAPTPSQLSALDVDDDGDLDLAVTRPTTGTLEIFQQLPGGVLALAASLAAPQAVGSAGQIDVNGDGHLDLVVGRSFDGFGTSYPLEILSSWIRGQGLTFTAHREWVGQAAPLGFGDMDRDGDVEPVGIGIFENLRFDGPEDGTAVQYGLDAATSGAGGIHPVLGSGGPTRPGVRAWLVIGRGRGGAFGVLLAGDQRADVMDSGFRRLVDSPIIPRTFVLDGPKGAPGKGSLALPVRPVAALIGRTRDFQVVLVDPGASGGLSATNGLEVHFGE